MLKLRFLLPLAFVASILACDEDPAAVGTCTVDTDCKGGLVCRDGRCALGDGDGDGFEDEDDNCPLITNPGQEDRDGDDLGDACDDDRDGDGHPNDTDNCPDLANVSQANIDNDAQGDACDDDDDGDGFNDGADNCPVVPNPTQANQDGDEKGDACDDDRDGDGIPNEADNCPAVPNANQADRDHDGKGDVCDDDRDGDGLPNATDNCPDAANPNQQDLDHDGIGDACDSASDDDHDGDPNNADNCPQVANPDQADLDLDGIGDACDDDDDGDGADDAIDNCLRLRNPDQKDSDDDGIGDACDSDVDGDGVTNGSDNCPDLANPSQADADNDGIGDACDDTGSITGGPVNDQCKRKVRRPFTTSKKWGWPGTQTLPLTTKTRVMMTPTVGDLDGDGITEVVFVAHSMNVVNNVEILGSGALVAVDGRNGNTKFMVAPAGNELNPAGSIAIANLDASADGSMEIVAGRYAGGLEVFSSTGALLWSCKTGSDTTNCVDYLHSGLAWGGPSIADLDHDGTPEIVYGATVFKRQPSGAYAIQWDRKSLLKGTGDNGVGALSVVADLDLDGSPEIVTGRTAYRANGDVMWDNATQADGFVALGQFDLDDEPEIVVVADAKIMVLEHDGSLLWGPHPLPFPTNVVARRGGAPTIGDFDGDGFAEVAVATNGMYAVFETDGSLLWKKQTEDISSAATGSSVFDFEGDGWNEVVYNDEKFLRVFDGETGAVLYETANPTATAYEYPVIADIDNDNKADIVVGANPYKGNLTTGLYAYGDPNWVKTRRIWNQHSYHVTNIEESGRVPRYETDSVLPGTFDGWPIGRGGGTYRANASEPPAGAFEPAADLQISAVDVDRRACSASSTIRFWVDNRGQASVPAGVEVAVYRGTSVVPAAFLAKKTTSVALPAGGSRRFAFVLTGLAPGEVVTVIVDETDVVPECASKANNQRTVEGIACD